MFEWLCTYLTNWIQKILFELHCTLVGYEPMCLFEGALGNCYDLSPSISTVRSVVGLYNFSAL